MMSKVYCDFKHCYYNGKEVCTRDKVHINKFKDIPTCYEEFPSEDDFHVRLSQDIERIEAMPPEEFEQSRQTVVDSVIGIESIDLFTGETTVREIKRKEEGK